MTEPLVFIAHSQADEAETEQLLAHLNVLRQAGRLDLWSEARIGYGSEREAAINAAVAEAKAAILLLSANFFNSDELIETVLPQLLAKQADSEITIIPVLARACAWQADNRLTKLAIFPQDHRPIWGGNAGRADEQLARLAIHLAETLGLPLEQVVPAELLGTAPAPGESPYKGLQYFDVADTGLFFGREDLTAKLVQRVKEHNFLAVVGASGSGKSSLVRAGLVAALQRGEPLADGVTPPKGSPTWVYHLLTPTAQPLKELAASLTRDSESVRATSVLIDDLAADPRSLDLAVHRLLSQNSAPRLLLLVDQFEELFTLCKDKAQQQAFVDNLLAAVAEPDGPTSLVITLRADFYAHCGQYEQLRLLLEQRQVYIGPMNPAELRRTIEQPAEAGDWQFEPGLVDLLLADVGSEPGSLPLLSHALLETWKRRQGRTLTLAGYAAAGRVQGAIAKTADQVYRELPPEQQQIARNIFMRLTELGEGTQDTRRRVALAELIPNSEMQAPVESVLKILADARLISTSATVAPEEKTAAPHPEKAEPAQAEVAHEALIREWPLLRQWLDEDREALRTHRDLTEAALDWDRNRRDPSYLYHGTRLEQAEAWAKTVESLNEVEQTFLQESLAERDREAQEREAQRRRELEAAHKLAAEAEARRQAEAEHAQEAEARAQEQKRAANNFRRLAFGLAVAALIAVALAGASVYFGIRARDSEATAQAQREAAEAELALSRASAPEDRLRHLNRLVELGRGDLVGAALRSLPILEQTAVLTVKDEQVVPVITALYGSVADVNRTGATDPLLEAMGQGLANLPAPVDEAERLQAELEQWLRARRQARAGAYEQALADYDQLAPTPAGLYERARVQAGLTHYQEALRDLDKVMATVNATPSFAATGQFSQAVGRLIYWVEPKLGELFDRSAADYPHLAAVTAQLVAAQEIKRVTVEAGPFQMGSESGAEDEQPVHEVSLAAFEIDQYEVTTAQYAACVDAGACDPPSSTNSWIRESYYGNPAYADYPMLYVDWFQAATYCAWWGGRLPTEAEWEKAARGTDGQTYPWGEAASDCTRANYTGCAGDTRQVGSHPAGVSPYGAYDMAGNVWEWVQSEYRAYPYQANDGRENLDSPDVRRGLRGGSWFSYDDELRAASRHNFEPTAVSDNVGFRCAR